VNPQQQLDLCSQLLYVLAFDQIGNFVTSFIAKYVSHLLKNSSAPGGLCSHDPLTRGFAPGPPWGHSPQTPIIGKSFLLRCVYSAALPLVCYYSIRLPLRVASWVNYSKQRTESPSERYSCYLSLLKADALWCENKRCSDSNLKAEPLKYDLWIRKRVCYPLHQSTPQRYRYSSFG